MTEPLEAHHNVVKYASGSKVDGDEVEGSVFVCRTEGDADGLSVNWLEYYEGERSAQVAEICKCSRLTVRKTGRYVELNVGKAATAVASYNAAFSAERDPLEAEGHHGPDPSHSLFKGLPDPVAEPEKAQALGDLLVMQRTTLHIPPV